MRGLRRGRGHGINLAPWSRSRETITGKGDQSEPPVQAAFEPYSAVRQKVLLTDDDASQRGFHTALGYAETHDVGPSPVRAYVRFDG